MKKGFNQVINVGYEINYLRMKIKKVIDHDHITGRYRSFAHSDCNINLELTKKVPVIFHKLKGYDSHLIMQEICKFDAKISVIPNGLESI